MLMRCCGSSSAGNSYALISSSGEILAIEAGVKFMDFKKMIDWRILMLPDVLSHMSMVRRSCTIHKRLYAIWHPGLYSV